MKNLVKVVLAASTVTGLFAAASARPAAAQWVPDLGREQIQYQRSSGWSSGDYFGAPRYPQQPVQEMQGTYYPGLQQNVRYQQGSCSTYIRC